MSKFQWVIEAPGPNYLSIQRLHVSDKFHWTSAYDKALCFKSEEQADAAMMALREILPELFAFECILSNAKAVEHGDMERG